MKWVRCADEMPPDDLVVVGWAAESDFYTAGYVEVKRRGGTWKSEDDVAPERFDSQDPNIFITHWAKREPPKDVPSKIEMRKLLKEDTCEHGVDWDDPCPGCGDVRL
jgi:hypothetical protein